MARIVVPLHRATRRRFERLARKTADPQQRIRYLILLRYADGWGCSRISEALGIAPATCVRVARRYQEGGEAALLDRRRENGAPKVDQDLLQALAEILAGSPQDQGWPRPTWTRELLARALRRVTRVRVSVSTVSRMLRALGARWGCPRPVVACPWSKQRKSRRLRQIQRAVAALGRDEVAYYEDEVDIHLNPKIGRDWMHSGEQKVVLTPGRNRKRYLAGALSTDGRRLVWVDGERKNTDLFLALLERLLQVHPKERRIHLILDNYVIHSSRRTQRFLQKQEARIVLHFLPPYCPEHNRIERLWRELHANVTRNHRCRGIGDLMKRVRGWMGREARRRAA